MRAIPALELGAELTEQRLTELAATLVDRAVGAFVVEQRWFGDKARTLTDLNVARQSVATIGNDFTLLLILSIEFASGDPVEYFVPLFVSRVTSETEPLATVSANGMTWFVIDAVRSEAFRRWLLTGLDSNHVDPTGTFQWTSQAAVGPIVERALSGDSRVSSAQQSNSSIVYGNDVILKVFRRLSSGINPEVELGRFLSADTTFRNMPMLLGEWSLTAQDRPPTSLAVAQTYIPNIGDGWSFTLEAIVNGHPTAQSIAGRLGQLTAQMHLALESARTAPDLAADLIEEHNADAWRASTSRAIGQTAAALADRANQYSGDTRELINTFLDHATRMTSQTEGYERLVGCTKTRVHGDYHLGQTLRTDDDFVILDFEGEPQRPVDERRQKTSPCKDVAGMLRSFGYARGAMERQSARSDRADLVNWERAARRAFLDQYVAESRNGGARYLPKSDDDIRLAIAAWELDKALYEVNYELNNRPDWLALPLAATLKLS